MIAYATPGGSTTSACTKTAPCTLTRAVSVIDSSRHIVKLFPGTYDEYARLQNSEVLEIYGPATIQFLSIYDYASNGSAVLRARDLTMGTAGCTGPGLTHPAATLDLKRVTLTPAADTDPSDASHCNVTLSQVTAHMSTAVGNVHLASGTVLTMDRTWIDGGDAGLNLSQSSSASVSNSIISKSTNAIVYDSTTTTSSVSFTTFYNTVWNCPASGNVLWSSNSNIYLNEKSGAPADTVTGVQCSHKYDLIRPQSTTPIGASNILNQDPRFMNAATGDFHLVTGSPAISAADPSATDAVDYEGTARPQGTGREVGAFEYKP